MVIIITVVIAIIVIIRIWQILVLTLDDFWQIIQTLYL